LHCRISHTRQSINVLGEPALAILNLTYNVPQHEPTRTQLRMQTYNIPTLAGIALAIVKQEGLLPQTDCASAFVADHVKISLTSSLITVLNLVVVFFLQYARMSAASVSPHRPICPVTKPYACCACNHQSSPSGLASADRSTKADNGHGYAPLNIQPHNLGLT